MSLAPSWMPILALIVSSAVQAPSLLDGGEAESMILSGARVWTGTDFVEQSLFIEDGQFVSEASESAARRVDLSGLFLVPPYADAHVHHFTVAETAAASRELFLSRGFFYLANLCGPHGARKQTAAHTNRPSGVDVLFAHGAITGMSAHPVPLYRTLHKRRGQPEETFWETHDDNSFYRVDSLKTLERKLDLLVATQPDLLKVMQSRVSRRVPGSIESLDPDFLPVIVDRAHDEGLRVVAHCDDAEDFAHVLHSGVDWLAHMPGFGRRAGEPLEEFLLSVELARAAAEAELVVITTVGAYDEDREDNSPAQEAVDRNLATLRTAGVTLAFGSDDWFGPETELRALSTHGGLRPVELLKMLCETTPRVLYPDRAVGSLSPGSEASLLALAADPREDRANLQGIVFMVKQGVVLLRR